MRRILQRFPSLLTRNLLHSPSNLRHSNTRTCLVPHLDRSISRFAFFSSDSNSTLGPKIDEVLSKEELKKRIQSFLDDGDEDALPDLFEAMMNRKLAGKHDESDDEVMEEVRKYPINEVLKVDDTDSGIESDVDSSDSASESDDGLSDADSSSDSDIGLSDADSSSDSDIGLSDADLSISEIESDDEVDAVYSELHINILKPKTEHSSDSDTESD